MADEQLVAHEGHAVTNEQGLDEIDVLVNLVMNGGLNEGADEFGRDDLLQQISVIIDEFCECAFCVGGF